MLVGASGSAPRAANGGNKGGKAKAGGKGKGPPALSGSTKEVPCRFFGSAMGCNNEACSFSHAAPNSIQPCKFKQRGNCDMGEACIFRHVPWSSPEQALAHYKSREKGAVDTSSKRYKELHRDTDEQKTKLKLGKEHVEGVVDRQMQVETYGSTAVKMMEKMGYKAGTGLGKDQQGHTSLSKPCLALETASQSMALGFGHFSGASRATGAERAARLAADRAQKRPKLEEGTFLTHNLLSEDEDTDDDEHIKAHDVQLSTQS